MPNIFFIGDTHFGHTNILKFYPGIRPGNNIHEHDEILIQRWNSVVAPTDIVWHLGDFAFKCQESYLAGICRRLNGSLCLILGNHDNFAKLDYRKWFTVYGVKAFKGEFILSHIPLHPNQLERFGCNIHGHLHGHNMDDPRYWNVSCEQINCTPIELSELRKKHGK